MQKTVIDPTSNLETVWCAGQYYRSVNDTLIWFVKGDVFLLLLPISQVFKWHLWISLWVKTNIETDMQELCRRTIMYWWHQVGQRFSCGRCGQTTAQQFDQMCQKMLKISVAYLRLMSEMHSNEYKHARYWFCNLQNRHGHEQSVKKHYKT